MRRFGRILLNAVTVLSALAALALVYWRFFGRPLKELAGYDGMNLLVPPYPFYRYHFDLFGIPYVLSLALSLILPVARVVRAANRAAVRRAEERIGRCTSCGYDLRATPQGGRCPECGAVPTPP